LFDGVNLGAQTRGGKSAPPFNLIEHTGILRSNTLPDLPVHLFVSFD